MWFFGLIFKIDFLNTVLNSALATATKKTHYFSYSSFKIRKRGF